MLRVSILVLVLAGCSTTSRQIVPDHIQESRDGAFRTCMQANADMAFDLEKLGMHGAMGSLIAQCKKIAKARVPYHP